MSPRQKSIIGWVLSVLAAIALIVVIVYFSLLLFRGPVGEEAKDLAEKAKGALLNAPELKPGEVLFEQGGKRWVATLKPAPELPKVPVEEKSSIIPSKVVVEGTVRHEHVYFFKDPKLPPGGK